MQTSQSFDDRGSLEEDNVLLEFGRKRTVGSREEREMVEEPSVILNSRVGLNRFAGPGILVMRFPTCFARFDYRQWKLARCEKLILVREVKGSVDMLWEDREREWAGIDEAPVIENFRCEWA